MPTAVCGAADFLNRTAHVPLPGEPAWPRFLAEIEAFLST